MRAFICLLALFAAVPGRAQHKIQLANHPSLSPDGKAIAFGWNGDIWTVSAEGGAARQLTNHPSRDSHPVFSPDGKSIAFQSDRDGGSCVYLMPAGGGAARQVTDAGQRSRRAGMTSAATTSRPAATMSPVPMRLAMAPSLRGISAC